MNRNLDETEWMALMAIAWDIKRKAFFSPGGQEFDYSILNTLYDPFPDQHISSDKLITAIYTLQDEDAVKIIKEYPAERGTPNKWVIEVIQPRLKEYFDELIKYGKSLYGIRDIKGQLEKMEQETEQKAQELDSKSNQDKVITPRLTFYANDGTTEYKTAVLPFKGKARALLTFLNECKNTPFSVEGIKENCNPNITVEKYHFRADKDIRDTVRYIREHLKVSKGEFFPIYKRENNWIWIEK